MQYLFVLVLVVFVSLSYGVPEDFTINKTLGVGYKLMYQSLSWPAARDKCEEIGAHLAVPRTQEEFAYLQKLVRAMHYPSVSGSQYKLLVWLGISNLDDYKVWKNIYGENIEDSPFHKWGGENGQTLSDAPEEPHCAGMDAINPGFRDFWCHRRQPYVCQIDLKQ